MPKLSKGTHLFFIDPDDDSTVKVHKPKNIDGIDAPLTDIDITGLDDEGFEYEGGMAQPGDVSLTIDLDPDIPSHYRMYELMTQSPRPVLQWAVGWSDGTEEPSGTHADGFDFTTAVTGRAYSLFRGHVKSMPQSFTINAMVGGTVAVKMSGSPVLMKKGDGGP
ncbi:phage tail tube protein [Gilvimarinus agarilyticus]|uniref:phage tail tube protein n=1 Tax=Gilvimarinus agarilyticus TaxID=679259 RepID=UPI0005A1674C|nr:phage tail tube protein [Gilvimarinus agarilyticus]